MSEENVALLKEPRAGLEFIINKDPKKLTDDAQTNGSKSTAIAVGNRKPQYFKMNEDEVEGAFKFIAGSNQSKAKLRKRADNQLTRLLVLTNTEVRTRGWIGDDAETLFAPQTLEDHALLKKRIYDMIDAKFVEAPAASTVPVTAEDSDKAASIARGKRNQQRRDALVNRFETITDKFKGAERFKGAEFGPDKYKDPSLLSSPK
jgi:hypothetical protein